MKQRRRPLSAPRTSKTVKLLGCVALLASGLAGPAMADRSAAHVVGLFDRLCYSTMPDIDAVETFAADGRWQAVTGNDLDAFRPAAEPDILKAWTFDDEGASFSLAVTRSPMDEQGKSDFPNFADATNAACSLVLTSTEAAPAAIGAEMESLVERKPDVTYEDGPFDVNAWSGGNERLQVLLYHYAPKSGVSGGLLSITVFQKP